MTRQPVSVLAERDQIELSDDSNTACRQKGGMIDQLASDGEMMEGLSAREGGRRTRGDKLLRAKEEQ